MAKQAKQQVGLVGLAVMGENLALNIESKGFSVAVFNRTTAKVARFIENRAAGKNIVGTYSPRELCSVLERPRKIILMVKAGEAVDAMIANFRPHLQRGDLLIDGGNSFFKDTERRLDDLAADGILYIGTGVSGGEEGALLGPCIMPGGSRKAYALTKTILERSAAQVDGPCCTYIGPRGAGHYVKMIHNGIEYGMMQCIAEVYDILQGILRLKAAEVSQTFGKWNSAELGGYLMEITTACLARVDGDTGKPLVDVILDKAGQKGTGKWTSQNALDLGVAVPTIDMAVEARILSAFKDERVAASKVVKGPRVHRSSMNRTQFIRGCRDALYVAVVACYAQGMALLREASREYDYRLDLEAIARIWKGGCIIRSKLLDPIAAAYKRDPQLANLLVDKRLARVVNTRTKSLRKVLAGAIAAGVPVLGLSSVLAYIDSYRTARLPQNLTQAQRDCFGAHTYERTDKKGVFHTQWIE
ncbi:MAG TPA: NADP-dependent phosphogluconate dehydrogenase [Phycisphaerae bacterium]|nr:NADP-dependent phosphogluconate dehydrogenase [Phycisphaerae bacterium]